MNNVSYDDPASSLQALWVQFVNYIPQVIVAILILAIGWIVASVVASIVRRILRFTGVDNWVEHTGLNTRFKLHPGSRYALVSNLVASIVSWVIILGAVGIAADTLHLTGVQSFIGAILAFIPNVIVAVIILTIGMIASQLLSEVVTASTSAAKVPGNRKLLGSLTRYAVIIFSVTAALFQLHVVPELIEIGFAGLVLALAISFGLGGKDHADQCISDLKKQA